VKLLTALLRLRMRLDAAGDALHNARRIVAGLRDGLDILYLVAHSTLKDGES
jgi:hypothetical protein